MAIELVFGRLISVGNGSGFSNVNNSVCSITEDGATLDCIDMGAAVVSQYIELLKTNPGIRKLNVAITHPHSDHIGGVGDLLEYCCKEGIEVNFDCGDAKRFTEYLKDQGFEFGDDGVVRDTHAYTGEESGNQHSCICNVKKVKEGEELSFASSSAKVLDVTHTQNTDEGEEILAWSHGYEINLKGQQSGAPIFFTGDYNGNRPPLREVLEKLLNGQYSGIYMDISGSRPLVGEPQVHISIYTLLETIKSMDLTPEKKHELCGKIICMHSDGPLNEIFTHVDNYNKPNKFDDINISENALWKLIDKEKGKGLSHEDVSIISAFNRCIAPVPNVTVGSEGVKAELNEGLQRNPPTFKITNDNVSSFKNWFFTVRDAILASNFGAKKQIENFSLDLSYMNLKGVQKLLRCNYIGNLGLLMHFINARFKGSEPYDEERSKYNLSIRCCDKGSADVVHRSIGLTIGYKRTNFVNIFDAERKIGFETEPGLNVEGGLGVEAELGVQGGLSVEVVREEVKASVLGTEEEIKWGTGEILKDGCYRKLAKIDSTSLIPVGRIASCKWRLNRLNRCNTSIEMAHLAEDRKKKEDMAIKKNKSHEYLESQTLTRCEPKLRGILKEIGNTTNFEK